jgi:serine/threonine protein kinase
MSAEGASGERSGGTSIGRYDVLELVGVGGMAEVFRVRARGPGGASRPLIIKRILPHLARESRFIHAFVAEAKILGMLHHPNVVSVYDFGEDAGRHYLALEYLDGLSLAEIMDRRHRARTPVPIGIAAYLAREICEGLSAVHTLHQADGNPLHIIHRDVTPSNVMTTRGGDVKLLDFGIAKIGNNLGNKMGNRIGISEAVTHHGQIKGKAAYLAPEQIRGEPIDFRVDLFTLGIVLHELLTLNHLFDGEGGDLAAAYRIVEMPIPPPSRARPEVPQALDDIVLRALARDPKDRFASASDMADALHGVVRATGTDREQLCGFVGACLASPATR